VSAGLIGALSAENSKFSQDNRNSACKRAHQGLDRVCNAKTPAERMRLFRRQRKFRRQVEKVEVDPGEVVALIDRGYLQPEDRDDVEP
jgi:hypothetical protein